MLSFTDSEARDLFDAIADAEAREGGRRFVVTVETTDGRSIAGHIVSTQETRLVLVVVSPPHNRGEQVDWEDISSVRIHPE
jgi:CelD/BcsL family acetyltransferase involved in cellulose biosynthesis